MQDDANFGDMEEAAETAFQRVFSKFLVGTEVCEKLVVNNYRQLKILAQVAIRHPNSLQQLRELRNGQYLSRMGDWTVELMILQPGRILTFKMVFKVKIPLNFPTISISCYYFKFSVYL